jgi:hypothetical protein
MRLEAEEVEARSELCAAKTNRLKTCAEIPALLRTFSITIGSRTKSQQKRAHPPNMDTQSIIAELEAERGRLNSAIAALQSSQGKRGRTASGRPDGHKRHLSAAARRRIGLAMKKRWAERKKKAAA